jgi:hypothetical protein
VRQQVVAHQVPVKHAIMQGRPSLEVGNLRGAVSTGRCDELWRCGIGSIDESDELGTSQIWEKLCTPQHIVRFIEANCDCMVDRDRGKGR